MYSTQVITVFKHISNMYLLNLFFDFREQIDELNVGR